MECSVLLFRFSSAGWDGTSSCTYGRLCCITDERGVELRMGRVLAPRMHSCTCAYQCSIESGTSIYPYHQAFHTNKTMVFMTRICICLCHHSVERSSKSMVSTNSPRLGTSIASTQRHPNMQQMTPAHAEKAHNLNILINPPIHTMC